MSATMYVIDVLVYHIELRYAGETAESVSLVNMEIETTLPGTS